MKTNIDYLTAMARIGESVVELVRESKLLRKKPGRRRGPYKKRRARKAANGLDRGAKRSARKRPLSDVATATE